jgi:exodeoxyribonuclease VII small subunit
MTLLSVEKIAALSFEEAMKKLENIVRTFESGGLTLQQSVSAYEEGMQLRKHCDTLLKTAKLRMEEVQRNAQESDVATTLSES